MSYLDDGFNSLNMTVVDEFIKLLTTEFSLSDLSLPENIEILAKFKSDIKSYVLNQINKQQNAEKIYLLKQFVVTDYNLTHLGVFIHRIWQLFYCFGKVNAPSKMNVVDVNAIIQRSFTSSEVEAKMNTGELAFTKFMNTMKVKKSLKMSEEQETFIQLGLSSYESTRCLKKCSLLTNEPILRYEVTNSLRTFELGFEIKFNDELRSRVETSCSKIVIIVLQLLLSSCVDPRLKNLDLKSYFLHHAQSDFKEYRNWPSLDIIEDVKKIKSNLQFAKDLILCCVQIAGGASLEDYLAGKEFVHWGRYSKMQPAAKDKLIAIKEERSAVVGHKRGRSETDSKSSIRGLISQSVGSKVKVRISSDKSTIRTSMVCEDEIRSLKEFGVADIKPTDDECANVKHIDENKVHSAAIDASMVADYTNESKVLETVVDSDLFKTTCGPLSVHIKTSPLLSNYRSGESVNVFTPVMFRVTKLMAQLAAQTNSLSTLHNGLELGVNQSNAINNLDMLCSVACDANQVAVQTDVSSFQIDIDHCLSLGEQKDVLESDPPYSTRRLSTRTRTAKQNTPASTIQYGNYQPRGIVNTDSTTCYVTAAVQVGNLNFYGLHFEILCC
jgi:hypothetical protein